MSKEFPHAQFLSVDVAPIVDHIPRANITFEVYDLASRILEADESFDLVRIEHVTEIVRQCWPSMLLTLLPTHNYLVTLDKGYSRYPERSTAGVKAGWTAPCHRV